ncbi:lysine N-methyltransferase [Fragilaria crotonensis]|nr:lysine N-methyltransferase [Fragilaria crotonensis]
MASSPELEAQEVTTQLQRRRPHPTATAFFDALDQRASPSKTKRCVTSDFVKKQSSSLGWRSRYSQAEDYPIFMLEGIQFSVKQVQRGEIEGTFGTGATVWPASMVLLKYLEKYPLKVRQKSVIDLGAGTGVTSLAAAVLGARRVVCTDGIQNVVTLAQANVIDACQQLENASRHDEGLLDSKVLEVCEYWWGSGKMKERFDVILVSDCVLPKLYPIDPLVDALVELMKDDAVAILSYEHRYYSEYHPGEKFRQLAAAKGLRTRRIPSRDLDPVYSVDDIEVWEVTLS